MDERGRYSVYNSHRSNARSAAHPLADLLPQSYDEGWHVARNLLKPLNHLDFLKQKETIAAGLNLHSALTAPSAFDRNYELLELHQQGLLATGTVIRHLSLQLSGQGPQVTEEEVAASLREYATVRHMEFHPSDVCNLSCTGCTYGHDDPERKPPPINFPFQQIAGIARLKPASMVIIGGGEPTLYRSGRYRFQEVVDEIYATNPGIQVALVTNGTFKPAGDWPDRLAWIRLSLDAATPGTYAGFRGRPTFRQVVANFLSYLDHGARHVGISFLFARSNVHEYAEVARFIFDLVRQERPHALHKVNIQYRPLRQDPYLYGRPFTEAVTEAQIQTAIREVRALADSSPAMKALLRDQTNIPAILGGNSHPAHTFARCSYSQVFRIVRANGDLRPCFIRVSEPDFILGNLKTSSLEAIALNTLYVGARRKPHCSPEGCRQCHVNYTLEQGLQGGLQPSDAAQVLADPMF